ncbi:MAG: pilus motility taxis protein HmpF [Symplocastrum torsivum CPER-KK1]|uniref:Pilus motility taxis protein HmpF n=1 Tax=Symplocastrum torsivum CPER-KK1 TaxID=450513 RepID=A0A951PKG0_9CYAN|nr:pilus motility taxis protein HmpF [Symplocastrum torsivum CPER-KK1]
MLYLAEVQKQKGGVFGGGKAELKLLACQRSDQSWSAVTGDEVIPADEANNMNSGTLVIVNLGGNRQLQGEIEPAGGRLVTMLQNFSRLLEKSKNQEEEIEQWKQSLTYQSQELNRREMEMESRLEQMQAMEEDFERLEQQRRELESANEETSRFREEFERSRQELEGAWEHLRGEQRRLEEQQAEVQYSAGLDENQASAIQESLERLSGAVAPTESVREQLNLAFEVVNNQQSMLDTYWQQLEQQQAEAFGLQAEVDRKGEEIQNRKRELHEAQTSLEQANGELKVQRNALQIKQEAAHMLRLQLQTQNDLHQELTRLATSSADVKISQKIDLEALEMMPLGQLSDIVQGLQQDLDKVKRFVNDQEEELTFQRQSVEEVQDKMGGASEYDRMTLETELAEEQDRYQMLDESLVGSRRNLREREEILNQHMRVLRRRQGVAESNSPDNQKIDLGPVLSQLEAQRQQQEEELRKLESQIEQMRITISQAEGMIRHQSGEQESTLAQLESLEQDWQLIKESAAQLFGRVSLYQETLQPRQDGLNEIRQRLEAIADALNQIQETGDYQLQAIAQMRQTINSLLLSPEFAAS